jgi:hypothetical protein
MTPTSRSKWVGQVAAALVLAAMLAGCSSVVDTIPTTLGGLPDGTPARPTTETAYPSVHDMPPPRQERALNEADTKRLREELKQTRARLAPKETTGSTGSGAADTGSARNP